jgi:hypothetical protein
LAKYPKPLPTLLLPTLPGSVAQQNPDGIPIIKHSLPLLLNALEMVKSYTLQITKKK